MASTCFLLILIIGHVRGSKFSFFFTEVLKKILADVKAIFHRVLFAWYIVIPELTVGLLLVLTDLTGFSGSDHHLWSQNQHFFFSGCRSGFWDETKNAKPKIVNYLFCAARFISIGMSSVDVKTRELFIRARISNAPGRKQKIIHEVKKLK